MAAQPTTGTASDAQARQAHMERHFESLLRIPWKQCPWPDVRTKMLSLALAGATIYAYGVSTYFLYVVEADGMHWHGSPREWAIRNGYDVREPVAGDDDPDELPTTGFVYYDKQGNVVAPEPFVFDDDWDEPTTDNTDGKEAR